MPVAKPQCRAVSSGVGAEAGHGELSRTTKAMTGHPGWLERERWEGMGHEFGRPVRGKDGGRRGGGRVWCPFATQPERVETTEGTDLNGTAPAPAEQESERPYERRSGVTAVEQRDAGR
jgi:hypothetical protein